jgi:conjugal transfer pilus assembly protein TraE
MLADVSHGRSQALLKQRNMLAVLVLTLIGLMMIIIMMFVSRDREIILQPVLSRPLTISSAGVTADYLEMVTRDTAIIALNRSPDSLEYWMTEVLKIVHPAAYGRVKSSLYKIVSEQKGSDISQAFAMSAMTVDPKQLTSDVTGTVTTFVGKKVISSVKKTFRFRWSYAGLTLSLVEFGELVPADVEDAQ